MKQIYILIALVMLALCSVSAQKKKAVKSDGFIVEQRDKTVEDSLKNIIAQAEKGNAVAQNVVGTWYYKGEHYAKDYVKALKWWTLSAKQQNSEAIGNMGLLYQYGHGVEADSVKALKFYVSSINKGNKTLLQQREALAEKGKDVFNAILCAVCYQEDKGIGKNLNKAVHFYKIAANAKSADAYRELAFISQQQGQDNTALRMFKSAADLGDIVSSYQYAKGILNSKTATGNEQDALIYLLRAAESGNPQAQCDLGTLYYQGKHITKDQTAAVNWFKKSAVADWTLAQWNLALCYINGAGIEKDFDQAAYWLGEATAKGYMQQFEKMCNDTEKGWKNKPFMTYLKGLSLYFSDKKDIDGAYAEFKKIRKESVEAQTMMSICIASKKAQKPNAKKAIKELSKLSDGGNNVATFYLATLFESGNGTDKDYNKAKELYQTSANGGYAVAQCYMGNLFYEGRIVERNYSEAVRYYKMAQLQGQLTQTAAKRYADCYEKGLGGLKSDSEKANQLRKRNIKNNVIPMLHKIE